ncbi:hypothetical protein HYX08_05955 [Candidatus Woesearchaeota archaeon]|nr:hypothetical protein [Candidatus Woesearchaeota archaeon]
MDKLFLIGSGARIMNASPQELAVKVEENFGRKAGFSGPINPYGNGFVNGNPYVYAINHKRFKASVRVYPDSGPSNGNQHSRYCGVYVSSGDEGRNLRILYAIADALLFDDLYRTFGEGVMVRPLTDDSFPEAYILNGGSSNGQFPNNAVPLGVFAASLEDIARFHKFIREGRTNSTSKPPIPLPP